MPTISARRIAFAAIVAVVLAVAYHLHVTYRQELRHSETLVSSMTQALAHQIRGSLRSIDGLLQEEAAAVRSGRWLRPSTAQLFTGRLKSYEEIRWIGYVTPDGTMLPATLPALGIGERGVDVSDRDYFTALRDGRATGLYVGAPVFGRVTGIRTIPLARAVHDANGRFAGVVVAGVNPDVYASLLEQVLVDPEGASAVIRLDGFMLARAPAHAEKFGINIADSALFQTFIPSSPVGVADLVSKTDGHHKLLGYQVLRQYGLVVTSGISMWHALIPWRNQAIITLIAMAGFLIVVWLGAVHADRLRARRQSYEAQLKAALARAERADIAKSRFLAAASHDLRQPFQAMVLYRDVLRESLAEPAQCRVLDALSTAMAAGEELLDALLHISTLEAGVTTPRVGPVLLSDLLGTLDAEFRAQARSQGLAWRCVRCSAVVMTDATLFARMVRNLVVNALKYTRSGKVLVGCRRADGAIRIEIWDTGPGVPRDKQDMIWEEFTQLGNSERDRSKGLGLGLAIVARTGRLLGHPIGLRSMAGRGSVFFISVPLATAGAHLSPQLADQPATPEPS